jgi:hypothetical protein
MPSNFRQTLLTGFVLRMNDGRDKRLQERVQDKLYTKTKWETASQIQLLLSTTCEMSSGMAEEQHRNF